MKVARIHRHGGPEVLVVEDIPPPKPGPQEVLIRIRAAALNHLDLWVREGMPGVKIPLPHILGCDAAGVLESVGPEVTQFKSGDEVILSPGYSCGQCVACTSSEENLCKEFGVFGETRDGTCAEYLVVPERNVLRKPQHLNFMEAAAMPLTFLTAWHMLVHHGQVFPGKTVLIHGAGSGIGVAAVQIAKLHGAIIFATASSQEKLDRAAALGAQHVINSAQEDFPARIRELTKKRGVDIVFEHIGEKTFVGSYRSLARGGKLITCGATTGWNVSLDLRHVFSKHLQIIGSTMGTRDELIKIMEFADKGLLKPVIDRQFSLADIQAAHRYLESRKHFGKVLVIP